MEGFAQEATEEEEEDAAAAAAALSRRPYVQLTTPRSAVIVWRMTAPSVRYGLRAGDLDREITEGIVRYPPTDGQEAPAGEDDPGMAGRLRLSSAPSDTFQYEWTLTDLEPSTRYHYAIDDGEHRLAGGDGEHSALTSPEPGDERPPRFWVVGDSGNGSALQRAVYDAAMAQVAAAGRGIDAYLHLGDMAYSGGRGRRVLTEFLRDLRDAAAENGHLAHHGEPRGHCLRRRPGSGSLF